MEPVKTGSREKRSREDIKHRFPLITGSSNLYRRKSSREKSEIGTKSITKVNAVPKIEESKKEPSFSKLNRHPYDYGLPLSRGKTKLKLISDHDDTDFRKLYYKREVTWQRPREPTLFEGVRSFCSYTGLKRADTEVRSSMPNTRGNRIIDVCKDIFQF
jgi:hypothetical protein